MRMDTFNGSADPTPTLSTTNQRFDSTVNCPLKRKGVFNEKILDLFVHGIYAFKPLRCIGT